MSVHVSSWAWKQTVGDAGAKLVLLKLADQADDFGCAFPFQKTLARDCEMSLATVKRKLKKLRELGLIESAETDDRSSLTYLLGKAIHMAQSEPGVAHLRSRGVAQSELGGSSTVSHKGTVKEPGPSSEEEGPRAIQISVDRAVREEIYGDADVKLTDREAKKVAVATTSIRKAEGTPQDVHERCEAYRKHKTYGGVALTAPSLAEHWSELATPAKKRATSKACPECGTGGGLHQSDCSQAAAA